MPKFLNASVTVFTFLISHSSLFSFNFVIKKNYWFKNLSLKVIVSFVQPCSQCKVKSKQRAQELKKSPVFACCWTYALAD